MKKKKIILILSNWYPNRVSPFQGDFVQRHAQAISLNNKVQVLHWVPDAINKIEIVENQVNTNLNEKIIYFPQNRFSWVNSFTKSFLLMKELRLYKTLDIIHLHNMYYHFWPLLFVPKPLIITEHFSGYLQDKVRKIPLFRKWLSTLFLKKATMVLPVSKNLEKGLQTLWKNTTYRVIPNVVEVSVFKKKSETHSGNIFLHISNLQSVKNIPILLEAAKILRDKNYQFIFKMGGNGDLSLIENYRKINNLESIIEVLPSMSYEEVATEMRKSDVFVLYSQFENQPCVIIESFASGIPVISSDVGGVSENFPSDFGMLIEKNKVEELVQAMEIVLQGKQFADSKTLHSYAEKHFSYEVISRKIDDIYKQVLE